MKISRRKGLLAGVAALVAAAFGVSALTSSVTAGSDATAKVGAAAPDFKLVDAMGKEHSLASYTAQGKIVVLEWFNAGCPFVVRHHEKYSTMKDLAAKFGDKVQWIAINSGAPGKEGYGMDKAAMTKWNISWPILIDSDGKVGRMYGAKTTPHMYIIDTKGVLRHAGAIDNDRADKMSADQKINYVDRALTEIIAGKDVTTSETLSYGCSVKYAN